MLKLWGKLIKDEKALLSETYTSEAPELPDALLECIEYFAKAFDIEAPIWHTNHTKQLGIFHKAVFKADDFIDSISFDKFEIQILDRE